MHSNVRYMLRKNDVAMPMGSGAFFISIKKHLIHLFIHQINSL